MSDTLSTELQEEIAGYEFAKGEVEALVDGLSDEQLNWRTEEGSWSILECISHLNEVGSKMIVPMKKEIDAGRGAGKLSEGPFKYSFLGNMFLNGSGPLDKKNKFKIKSPKLYIPTSDLSKEELLPRFLALQDELVALTRDANGLNLKSIKVTSPAISLVRFSVGVWLKMLPGHQKRHLQQARRVRDQLPQE